MAHAKLLVQACFDLVDSMQQGTDLVDVLTVGGDGGDLFDDPDWMLEELQPSVNDNVRLSIRLVFDEVKDTCFAGIIETWKDFLRVCSLNRQGV